VWSTTPRPLMPNVCERYATRSPAAITPIAKTSSFAGLTGESASNEKSSVRPGVRRRGRVVAGAARRPSLGDALAVRARSPKGSEQSVAATDQSWPGHHDRTRPTERAGVFVGPVVEPLGHRGLLRPPGATQISPLGCVPPLVERGPVTGAALRVPTAQSARKVIRVAFRGPAWSRRFLGRPGEPAARWFLIASPGCSLLCLSLSVETCVALSETRCPDPP
jgi:hypothetical protein